MAEQRERPAWEGVIEPPRAERLKKPRESGWTMVVDKGLGLHAIDDLMQVASPCIDLVKLALGSPAFFGFDLLKEKVRTITAHGVYCMPGGSLEALATRQGRFDRYLERARDLGFTGIEVSDRPGETEVRMRAEAIGEAAKAGLRVVTEVAPRDRSGARSLAGLAERVNADLDGGAFMVTVGARAVFDASGLPDEAEADALLGAVRHPGRILWEAPLDRQQRWLVRRFGSNVNLAGILPEDVLALEALRSGVRGDPREHP